jgi:hypothetical protein
MKRAILLLGSICLLSLPSRAYIYTGVTVSDNYRQTQPNKLLHLDTGIYAGAILGTWDGSADTADDVAVFKPNGDDLTITSFSSDGSSLSAIFYEGYASTKKILNGNYVIHFTGGTLDGYGRDYHVNTKLFPKVLPQITRRSFRALSSKPVSRPIRIVFPAYRTPKGAATATTTLSVQDANLSIFSVNVDPKTAKVVIPAGTLEAGKLYTFYLVYQVETVAGENMLSQPIYISTNAFSFTTSSRVATSTDLNSDDFDEEEAEFSRLGDD